MSTTRTAQRIEDERREVGDPNGMSWLITALFLIAETTSLGVLGLPQAVKEVGLIPGLVLINVLYLLLWYTGMIVFRFKMQYFHIHSFADGLELIFGRWSRWIGNPMMVCYLIFVMAAHIVGFTMMMSTLAGNGTCSIVWKVVAAVLYVAFTFKRSLNGSAWVYVVSCISILIAAIVAMFGVGLAPPSDSRWFIVARANTTSLSSGAEAISYIIVASMAHIAYPTIISEMKRPHEFPKALALQQISTLLFANIVAIVFYLRGGEAIASPALGSGPPLISKIAWGFSAPSVVVCGTIAAMIAAKLLYGLYWGKNLQRIRTERTWRSIGSWNVIGVLLSAVAFLLAWGVPIFNHLFSLMGALFGTSFALIFPNMFWFRLSWVSLHASERPPSAPQNREASTLESGSGTKETHTQVERRATESSQGSDAPRILTVNKPLRSIWTAICQYAFIIGQRPVLGTLNTIIFLAGVAVAGLGTFGAVIGIMNISGTETSLTC